MTGVEELTGTVAGTVVLAAVVALYVGTTGTGVVLGVLEEVTGTEEFWKGVTVVPVKGQ